MRTRLNYTALNEEQSLTVTSNVHSRAARQKYSESFDPSIGSNGGTQRNVCHDLAARLALRRKSSEEGPACVCFTTTEESLQGFYKMLE
jgi:hypothetical protein